MALHEQIENQPPNTSHRQLAEITGVPKSTIARAVQQQEKLRDERKLRRGQHGTFRKRKGESRDADVEEAHKVYVSVKLARRWVITISKQQTVVSMEMQVWERSQEGTRPEEQC
jgi:DNA-binding transcriptional MocR family regulator